MDQLECERREKPQPTWTVTLEGESQGDSAPSLLVEVQVTLRLEVQDVAVIGLGAPAAMAGHRVKYVLAAKLVNELVEAADERVLSKTNAPLRSG